MGAQDKQTVLEEKIVKYGSIEYPQWNLGASGSGTEIKTWYDRIFHNLGYVPSYETYVKVSSEAIFNDDEELFLQDYYYVPFGASYSWGQTDPAGGATISFVAVSGADEQYLYIARWVQNVNAYPVSANGGTIKYLVKSVTAT